MFKLENLNWKMDILSAPGFAEVVSWRAADACKLQAKTEAD